MAQRPLSPTARAERASARFALWASLVLTALAAVALGRFAQPLVPREIAQIDADQARWLGIDFARRREVELLRSLVAIDTSEPHPDEERAAELLAAELAAAGLAPVIERFGDRHANVWAFVEGEDPRAVVLHSHLDVEPLLEDGDWRHPPLSGAIEGPWIYGRGMYDVKSLTVAQLLATLEVARAPRRPRRSLLFLATSSEEVGSDLGTRWILAEHPDLVARMDLVLTEGGVIEATDPSRIKYWGIEFAQKRFARLSFCSSRREDLTALARIVQELPAGDPAPRVEPSVATFLAAYAPTRDHPLARAVLADPQAMVLDAASFAQLTPFLRSLFRDEVIALRVDRDGDGWVLPVSVHLLPASDAEATLARLVPDWVGHGVSGSLTPFDSLGSAVPSPVDHPDFGRLVAAVRGRHPTATVGPYFLPWAATDARFWRQAGIRTYGFSPFAVIVSETTGIGKPNERMQLPAFVEGVELYADAVRALVE